MKRQASPSNKPSATHDGTRQGAGVPAMERNAGMDALVKHVHASKAFSFEAAENAVERAMGSAKCRVGGEPPA
ncbi:hypothetical protein ACWKW4_19920 [Hydrogenophaga borbori]